MNSAMKSKSLVPANCTEVDIDEAEQSSHGRQTPKQRYFGGIRRTLRVFTLVASLILIINVSWLAYAVTHYGISNGYGTIQSGDCASVKSVNTWLHLGVNILSTLLLTASNTFMAVYCCPSRKEVDKAHQRRKPLQIGNLSLGNLGSIAKRKAAVVLVLALSSVPFHLLYNSLVFTSESVNEYYWTVANEDFLTGSPFNLTGDWNVPGDPPLFLASPPYSSDDVGTFTYEWVNPTNYPQLAEIMNDYFEDIQRSAPAWERLENKDCIQEYSNLFDSTRRNVVLVSSTKSENYWLKTNVSNSILTYGDTLIDFKLVGNNWICSKPETDSGVRCNPEDYVSSASSWTVFDFPIEYCLSQQTEDVCSVNFSLTIMLIVIAFNALKLVMMIWVLIRFDAEKILISVGDAAASFLEFEDPTTLRICLASKREMKFFWDNGGQAKPFSRTPGRWGSAVSRIRLALFFGLMLLCFGAVSGLAAWGFAHINDQCISITASTLWNLGFGVVSQKTMVIVNNAGIGDAITVSLLANAPQVVLAVIYILYMGIMTSMFLAADWSNFAFKPQTLMVSSPAGKQRGTWLLGAPLGWGLILLTLQVLLHWFVSQSIFVVQMRVVQKDGVGAFWTYTNCGYSPIAIIFSLATAVVLVLSAVLFVWRKFPKGAPPVVSTCSAAISAACHPRNRSKDMVHEELRWGVDGGVEEDEEGHCSLMAAGNWQSDEVNAPIDGSKYAGLPER